ncbi:MAG: hypothetical protein ACRD30_06085 [Bryobacteraceae bacterium]
MSRGSIAAMEKSIDSRFTKLWDDNPFVLVGGPTRGIYLEGYGAVFMSEVNLATGPTMIFRPSNVTREERDRHRQKKLQRLPQLRAALEQALADSAASLDTVPSGEQIVISVLLTKYPWEDVTGLPSQIMMQGQKGQLLAARRSGEPLETAIHETEF